MDTKENLGLLTLRLGVGGVLMAHGVQKLFGWLGGGGISGTAAMFEQIGVRPGRPSALASGLAEAGGGALIALGLATPVAGAAAAGNMVTAATVHAPSGFFNTSGGYEFPALLGLSAASLSVMGPGDWSVDGALGHRYNRGWVAGASLLGAAAAAAAVVWRRRQATTAAPDPAQVPQSASEPAPAGTEAAVLEQDAAPGR